MSRVGKKPITMPSGVDAKIESGKVTVKGPLGEISINVHPKMAIKKESSVLTVARPSDQKIYRELHGLTRNLLANMVTGVSKGYEKTLEISGVGYKAALVKGENLMLSLGYSHPVIYNLPAGVKAEVQANVIIISGIDKQLVGEVSAQIRKIRKPEPYKGKGIKYADEILRRKAGKTAGKTEK